MRTDDDAIWKTYTKNVAPARHAGRKNVAKAVPQTKSASGAVPPSLKIKKSFAVHAATFRAPIDEHIERRLRAGDITPEARIDLHGMTRVKAHDVLCHFLETQIRLGRRNLLVITGKGAQGKGVLRDELPKWLEEMDYAPHILALRPASARHGGSGAFYVILRKTRSD